MNEQSIKRLKRLHNGLLRFKNTVIEVNIYPMFKTYGNDNYNLRINFKQNRLEKFIDVPMANWLKCEPSDKRLIKVKENYQKVFNKYYFEGMNGFECNNIYDYLQTVQTIKSWINHFFPKVKVSTYDYDNELINYNTEYKYDVEITNKRIKNAFRGFDINTINECVDMINGIKINWMSNLRVFMVECDNSYDKYIIGKIRSDTALTPKELERYKEFKNTYKEMIKIKSFIRNKNVLIKQ